MGIARELLAHAKRALAGDFLNPAGYFFAGWLVLYLLVGCFIAVRRHRVGSIKAAIQFCLPRNALMGRSAKLDYQVLILSHYLILYPLGLYMITGQGALAAKVAPAVSRGLAQIGRFTLPVSHGFWVEALYTLGLLAAADFGWALQHLLFHRVAFLWRFHKVHHSASELNIFTIARLHPLDALTQAWFAGVAMGSFMGFCKATLGYTPSLVQILNASWAMALYRVFGIFRHSHIWISFGPTLSRVFSSPAMHQVHHSIEEKHHDKNFAVVFAFWDALFGTLYVPRFKEELRFGVQTEPFRKYETLTECLVHPFVPDSILKSAS